MSPKTFKQLIDEQLMYEPKGVANPEETLWELKEGLEGFTSGLYYPVANKAKNTPKGASLFKDVEPKLSKKSAKGSPEVTYEGESVKITKEESSGDVTPASGRPI